MVLIRKFGEIARNINLALVDTGKKEHYLHLAIILGQYHGQEIHNDITK